MSATRRLAADDETADDNAERDDERWHAHDLLLSSVPRHADQTESVPGRVTAQTTQTSSAITSNDHHG